MDSVIKLVVLALTSSASAQDFLTFQPVALNTLYQALNAMNSFNVLDARHVQDEAYDGLHENVELSMATIVLEVPAFCKHSDCKV